MATQLAIEAHHVTKMFASHHRATSIKERLVRRPGQRTIQFRALNDVSVEIPLGTTVGLIGPNGSGKSTLLKVLAGILRPSTGTVRTHGRIASLLELGAGFNSELTGRENVYLNASLLGLSRRETDRLFSSILEFSELEEFIDNPVKHYSSGMYVRLGFSVAVHVDPDILLVDEVLAVGDEAFSRKCLDKIAEFQHEGRTILFVSHALDLVQKLCDRTLVLEHGTMVFDGNPEFGVGRLRSILGTLETPAEPETPARDDSLNFGDITVSKGIGQPAAASFDPHDEVAIRVEVNLSDEWATKVRGLQVTVMGVGNLPIWGMTAEDASLPCTGGHWVVDFLVKDCPPLSGRFIIGVQLTTETGIPIAHTISGTPFGVDPQELPALLQLPFTVDANVRSVVG